MTLLRPDKDPNTANPLLEWPATGAREVLKEETFKRMIAVERKRTERSREPFLLMLLEGGNHQSSEKNGKALDNTLSVLPISIRETDVIGWYTDRTAVGVMFTGLSCTDKNSILSAIINKVSTTLRDQLTTDQFNQISISFHFFPDDWDQDNPGRPSNPSLYPDLLIPDKDRSSLLRIKQVMDFVGSSLMLMVCTPLLLMIAVAIKASSRGPVLFRQQRVGQYGRCFTFLKFRSMRADNDHSVHKEYATKLIAGQLEHRTSNGNADVYKMTNDPRITRLGKFLRRTSLDELPQLVNVLKGDMSLVGPRPAIPYELAAYQTWHRRRVLEVKPGITGLWQVTGRSTVKFDEMVRLDLRYATSWSPWLDIKILMRTPRAVIGGAGAH
ncbi:sugar transferase [Tunturibacter psychrotolerans]|uniref:Sugar transferase n=1 Tax=Tunturiibacter psychrotolerans TaxID=3069686 RepID=A0AAU7ZNE0_9BACT